MVARPSLLVIVFAACGSNAVSHIGDAPPSSDAKIDGASPDGPPAAVELTATIGGVAESDLIVYFQSADSTTNTTTTTDATGTATGSVGEGGFVTVINPFPGSVTAASPDRLLTWTAVRPGDHLLFNDATGTINVTFELPTISPNTTYDIATTCGNGTLTVQAAAEFPPTIEGSVALTRGCIGPQDIVVVALDGNGQAADSFFMGAQTLTNNGTADYHLQTYTAAIARTYTWNDDSDTATINVQDTLQSALGNVFQSQSLVVAGTPPTLARKAPAFGGLRDVVQASAVVGTTKHEMDEWGQGATYAGDWNAHRLPDFTSNGAYDPTTKQVTWDSTGGAIQPNVSEVELAASRSSDEHAWDWIVIAGNAPVQLPTLPTTTYDWNIASTDTSSVAGLGVANVPGDPGDARANFAGPTGDAAIEIGSAGVLSLASYQPAAQPALTRR